MDAPDGSLTDPETAPLLVCADATGTAMAAIQATDHFKYRLAGNKL
jgi:hypothetical protein